MSSGYENKIWNGIAIKIRTKELTEVESKTLRELYHNLKAGESGVKDLVRKRGLSSKIDNDWYKPIRYNKIRMLLSDNEDK